MRTLRACLRIGREWDEFREEDGDPIGVEAFKRLTLQAMPEDVHIWIME